MDYSEPGPSSAKKPKQSNKTLVKRFLTEEELERMLYESDDDLENPTFIDEDANISSSDDEDDREDDHEDDSVLSRLETRVAGPSVDDEAGTVTHEEATVQEQTDSNYIWTDVPDLKNIGYDKINELLLHIGKW